MIELEKLVKRFGDLVAVNEIDLSVARGEFFAVLGPNAAGDYYQRGEYQPQLGGSVGQAVPLLPARYQMHDAGSGDDDDDSSGDGDDDDSSAFIDDIVIGCNCVNSMADGSPSTALWLLPRARGYPGAAPGGEPDQDGQPVGVHRGRAEVAQ